MRRLLGLAALAAALFMPSPVAAGNIAPYLVPTAPDAAGCTGLEIHGGEGLILTLAPWDGPDQNHVQCAFVGQQIRQQSKHRLIFTWQRWQTYGRLASPAIFTYVWETTGYLDGTRTITRMCPNGQHSIKLFDGDQYLISQACHDDYGGFYSSIITGWGTLPGSNPGAGASADGKALPVYVKIKQTKIAYAANADSYINGRYYPNRELWVSDVDGTGRLTMVDVQRGGGSSFIRDLVSHGDYATFTANDGHGRAHWITDGTVKGTHKVNG